MQELEARPGGEAWADPRNRTVLIVDDDEAVLNLLEILIRRDGFKIERAASGEEALEKLKSRPDAVVLDFMLPGISAYDVLRRLRSWSEPIPPVIVVTAFYESKEIQEMKRDPNVVLFLSKPINQEKLLQALHKVLVTQPQKLKNPH